MKYTIITINPEQMGGVPCIRGLRIPVATVVSLVANGLTNQQILDYYPDLVNEDIKESLHFASEALKEKTPVFHSVQNGGIL